jgi:hypothetical protein
LLSGKTRNVVVGEWVEVGIMHALVCLQGKWSLIMQLSLTFAIFDHPHLWRFFYKKSLFKKLFLGPIFALGWAQKETEIFSLKFLFFLKKIHQFLKFIIIIIIFWEIVVTLQLSY